MDKELLTKLLNMLEDWHLEILALKSLAMAPHEKRSKQEVDSLVREWMAVPELREAVSEQWKPLRHRIESEADLEKLLLEFLRVVPKTDKIH